MTASASNKQVVASVELEFQDTVHKFNVVTFKTEEQLRTKLQNIGINFIADTIAYCDCWSNAESILNGNVDFCGTIYLLTNSTIGCIAHESLHMALGILSRMGYESLPITANKAPKIEDYLCELVEFITQEIVMQVTDMELKAVSQHGVNSNPQGRFKR